MVFDPAQRAEALKQGNAIMRKFLGMLYLLYSFFIFEVFVQIYIFLNFVFCFSNPSNKGGYKTASPVPDVMKQNVYSEFQHPTQFCI